MNILKKFFSIDITNGNHCVLVIFGIKFNILKYSLLKKRKEFMQKYKSYSDITKIPCAEDNLRLIQLANVTLLKMFDKICMENNLNYWIDFGTLLGAIRHKGFIPWDDDIDVGMPREDYECLINLFEKGILDFVEFEFKFKNNNRNKCFLKFKYKESNNVTLDVFPYDWYYKSLNSDEKEKLSLKITKLVKLNKFRYIKTERDIRASFSEQTKRNLLDNHVVNLDNCPALFMGIDFPHKWKRKVFDYETVFPLRKVIFEGYLFNAPKCSDEYLRNIYGDFMSLPKDIYPRHSAYLYMSETEIKTLKEFIK